MSLDEAVKITQGVFYVAGGTVALLTHLKAKKTLLSSVNTEVSDLLLTEFDEEAPRYWAKHDPIGQIVFAINKEFSEAKDQILKSGEFHPGILMTEDQRFLLRLLETLKTDPFLPKKIRDIIADLLTNRVEKIISVYKDEARAYANGLAKGKHVDTLAENKYWIHNRVNDALYKRGCGISQIRDEVHKIRLAIQSYLESFDPRQ